MRFSRMAVAVLLATIAGSTTVRAQTTPPPLPTVNADLTAVKKDMVSLRTWQEVYYSDNNTYSAMIGPLKMTPSDGVTLKILEAGQRGWAGTGTLAGTNGVSCAIFVGGVSAAPKTERGVVAEKEGIPVCDGVAPTADPLPKAVVKR